ncbi:unnamed protein product [Amoebophrya sp. A25]|nr:unnamed protein product [Amoebophrya sp. A25]|eukprot:GSA25T00014374001.1
MSLCSRPSPSCSWSKEGEQADTTATTAMERTPPSCAASTSSTSTTETSKMQSVLQEHGLRAFRRIILLVPGRGRADTHTWRIERNMDSRNRTAFDVKPHQGTSGVLEPEARIPEARMREGTGTECEDDGCDAVNHAGVKARKRQRDGGTCMFLENYVSGLTTTVYDGKRRSHLMSFLSCMLAAVFAIRTALAGDADMSHSFDMTHHIEDNIMAVRDSDLVDDGAEARSYNLPSLTQLECRNEDHAEFMELKNMLLSGDLEANAGKVIEAANRLAETSFADEMGLYKGVDDFFHDICDLNLKTTQVCLYGLFNALVVLALAGDTEFARPGLRMLGNLQCLDYLESSSWRFKSADLQAVLQNSTLWKVGEKQAAPHQVMLTGKNKIDAEYFAKCDVSAWMLSRKAEQMLMARSSGQPTNEPEAKKSVRMLLFGTHPTLTLEPYTMIADHVFPQDKFDLDLQGVFGISYKCHIYPLLCNDNDPIATLLGAFDKADETYTTDKALLTLEAVFESLKDTADVFICTSPFFLCAVMAALLPAETLQFNFMGLPALWKAPHDVADNMETFWEYGHKFFRRENSVHVTNNFLLFEQLRYMFGEQDTTKLRVLRPHNRYMNAYYVPRKHLIATAERKKNLSLEELRNKEAPAPLVHYVGLVSRTKFQWVTFECLFKRLIHEGNLPFDFEVLNTDSKLSFQEMGTFTAMILVPWEAALMAFYEFYSMNMPLFVPSRDMLYRTVYHAEGNLGTTKNIYHVRSPRLAGADAESIHPYPPFAFEKLDARIYWLEFSDFVRWPGIRQFFHLQELVKLLLQEDAPAMAAEMKLYNDKTFASSVAFYRRAFGRFFA